MKKIFLILDGMADREQEALGGKTPLEYADTPNLDKLYSISEAGCVRTIPDGEEAGSAVANLNLLGYSSTDVYKGRAVIEAAGAGIDVDNHNLYIRCNFVTFRGDSFEESVIESYSAHDIETKDALPLSKKLNEQLLDEDHELINSGSFRNILIGKEKANVYPALELMPSHDIIGQPIMNFLKGNKESSYYYDLTKKAYEILSTDNDTKANGIWLWGASVAPQITDKSNPQKKIILSETILMKGIANLFGIECVSTNEAQRFESFLEHKLVASLKAIKGDNNFIYIHIQKPDDLSHELMPKEKAQALEIIDKRFVKELIDSLDMEYALVVASDHYTFSDTGGHGREPAPYMLIKSTAKQKVNEEQFTEKGCIAKDNTITTKTLHEKLGR